MNKIINLKDRRKSKQNPLMFFLNILIGALAGFIIWHYFVENFATVDVEIPESRNIVFNSQKPIPMTAQRIADEFEMAEGKPILIYIYTTWCSACKENLPVINEISREFQNTDLRIFALAIDRDITQNNLQNYLNGSGDIYFRPMFLSFKEGFLELFKRRKINYNNRIPFTVLIGRDGKIITKFTGTKSKNYLRNKIIRQFN